MEDWEKELKEVCLKIPFEKKLGELNKIFEKYLKLREKGVICKECQKTFVVHSPGELRWGAHCKNCKEERRKEKQKEEEKWKIEGERKYQEQEKRKLENFEKGYGNTPAGDFWILIPLLTEETIRELKAMDYPEFLETKYWKVISRYVKYRQDYKCQLCGSKDNLNVHHKNYDIRGEEYHYWKEDLIVLCKNCHAKFHDKMEKIK